MRITCHICEGKGKIRCHYPADEKAFMRSVLGSKERTAFKTEYVDCTLCEGKGFYVKPEKRP